MKRSCLAVLVILSLSLSLSARADKAKDLERRLQAGYEGRVVRLDAQSTDPAFKLRLPKQVRRLLNPFVPVHLELRSLKLKPPKLKVKARPVVFYKDPEGNIVGALGYDEKYEIRLNSREPNEESYRRALDHVFPPLTEKPADWSNYWPPAQTPQDPKRENQPRPSREIAPEIFTIGDDMTPPACLRCPDPEYPEAVRRKRIQGLAISRALITENGRVAGIQLTKSSGNKPLDLSAIAAISRWKFTPAIQAGQPVRVVMVVETKFYLY